jgi:hypothetical protein
MAKTTSKKTANPSKPKGNGFTDRNQPRPDLVATCITECRPTDRQGPSAVAAVNNRDSLPTHAEQSAVGMHSRGVSLTEILLATGLKVDRLIKVLGLEYEISAGELRYLREFVATYGLPPAIDLPRSVQR